MVGIVSDETLCEMAAKLTGVPVQTELKRLKRKISQIHYPMKIQRSLKKTGRVFGESVGNRGGLI